MNERIRELAEQATEYFPKTEASGEYWKFDKEKFAELIVRECAAYAFSHEEDYYAMLNHFGVEE